MKNVHKQIGHHHHHTVIGKEAYKRFTWNKLKIVFNFQFVAQSCDLMKTYVQRYFSASFSFPSSFAWILSASLHHRPFDSSVGVKTDAFLLLLLWLLLLLLLMLSLFLLLFCCCSTFWRIFHSFVSFMQSFALVCLSIWICIVISSKSMGSGYAVCRLFHQHLNSCSFSFSVLLFYYRFQSFCRLQSSIFEK